MKGRRGPGLGNNTFWQEQSTQSRKESYTINHEVYALARYDVCRVLYSPVTSPTIELSYMVQETRPVEV